MALPSGKKRGWKIPEDLQAFRQLRQWWTSLDARNFLVPEDVLGGVVLVEIVRDL
jgi:hypothetical protein